MSFSGIRVGLVGPLPPPAGGMANQTRQLAELLRSGQAEVTLVQTNAPYRPAWAAGLPGARALFRLVPYIWALWRAAGRSDVLHIMANSGWSWHLFAAPAIWVGRLRGVPVVVNYRGGEAAEFLKSAQSIVRVSMARTAQLIVPSAFLQEIFARFRMPSTIVPNIIDLARFSTRGPRVGASAHLVVARNLEPLYDNATAIRAFHIVRSNAPAARLTIAGSGPQEAELRQLVTDLGLNQAVQFTGRLDRDAMAALYREADVMLNPSLADNMPNSLLESMASGVPVVSTRVGGVPYMVEDGETALLVPAGDAEAMAHACLRLLQEAPLWERLHVAGLARVQRYTWSQVGPLLAAQYTSAIGASR
ncbi:MAG: glycosyltransferase family 4 protein [Burkholderiales bacterium]|nr:glycosyltransferase family 4 protein [Burkholderiales bacterium]